MQSEYQQFLDKQSRTLSSTERQAILQLAEDIPALWRAETTTNAQRKEIMRQLITTVNVTINENSEQVSILIEWTGGISTHSQMIRPVAKLEQLSYYPQLCECIRNLVSVGIEPEEMAQQLNQKGYHPPKRAQQFRKKSVQELMRRLGIPQRLPVHLAQRN